MTADDREARALFRLRIAAVAAGALLAAYWLATLVGVASSALSFVYTVVLPLVVPFAWWAAVRAQGQLRRFVLLAASAITFQGIGSLLWYVAYLENGSQVPDPPGYWTPFLYVALLLSVAAVWTGVRDALRLHSAMLDYSIVMAAFACLTVAVVDVPNADFSAQTLDAVARPTLCLLLVVLIASAALGRWQGLPLPVGLVGISLLFTAAGSVWFSYLVAHQAYVDDRWPNLLWFTGAVIALVAAATIILRIDRPIRMSREALPGISPLALLVVQAGALGMAAAVTLSGVLRSHELSLWVGGGAVAWIGLAGLLRALGALRETRGAYRRLDEAHLSLERAHDRTDQLVAERDTTIEELARRNVELTAIQTMLGSVFDLADERSNGELRTRLEEAAEDIVAWLPPRGDPEH